MDLTPTDDEHYPAQWDSARTLEAYGKAAASILNAAMGCPPRATVATVLSMRTLSNVAWELLQPSTTHERANELIDEMIKLCRHSNTPT